MEWKSDTFMLVWHTQYWAIDCVYNYTASFLPFQCLCVRVCVRPNESVCMCMLEPLENRRIGQKKHGDLRRIEYHIEFYPNCMGVNGTSIHSIWFWFHELTFRKSIFIPQFNELNRHSLVVCANNLQITLDKWLFPNSRMAKMYVVTPPHCR